MTTSEDIIGSTTNPAAARVQKIAAPVASPGVCILCGKSEHPEGFADARLDFEYYGTLYICGDCVGDFARVFGWIHPRQAYALAKSYDDVSKELEIHRQALLHLEQSVEELTNYRMLRSAITEPSDDGNVDSVTNSGTTEVDGASSGDVISFPGADSTAEQDASESVTKQGPDDVSGTRSDESADGSIPLVEL